MNTPVRQYLIEVAKNKQTVSYSKLVNDCKLSLELENITDRNILASILGEIATYEHHNGRPILSALVLYKDSSVHGPGFYNICEDLGIGDAKSLEKQGYAFKELNRCYEYWVKEDAPVIEHQTPFFTSEDLTSFIQIAGKPYRKDDPESLEKAEVLKLIYEKANYWAKSLNLESYEVSQDNRWQISGSFKSYAWCKVFKSGQKDKLTFFTIGVSDDELFIKLDCQRISSVPSKKLSKAQVEKFDHYIKDTGASWKSIPHDRLKEYNWDRLISETRAFIATYSKLYDEIIEYVWGEEEISVPTGLKLTKRPEGKYTSIPKPEYNFQGRETDFLALNKYKHHIGNSGEKMVIAHEKEKLKKAGHDDLAKKVKKVLDGEGYDIRSYDKERNLKYIEVKTTKEGINHPFYLTDVELAFMQANVGKYVIYRIYNFKPLRGYGEYYILSGDIEDSLLLQPKSYQVHIKKSI